MEVTLKSIEQLWQYAKSKEVLDYINSLDSASVEDDNRKIAYYHSLVILYNAKDYCILFPFDKPDNTTSWIHLDGAFAVIMPQHLISRYRKRIMASGQYNIRSNVKDKVVLAINTILNIQENMHLITGICINSKYDNSTFAWCKFGLIPMKKRSDIVYEGITFIAEDMLNKEQLDIWNRIRSEIVELK